jgi:hypothetical protein
MNFKNHYNTKAFRENPLICNVQYSSMKSGFPVLLCLFLFILGCSKDKFNVNPSLRIKSYSKLVSSGEFFNAVLEYSQKKGKISGDSLTIIRHRYNQKPVSPPDQQTNDTILTILNGDPDAIPDANSAEFNVSLDYTFIHIDNGENDSIDFRFILTDLSGRKSDTVRTGMVVLLNN